MNLDKQIAFCKEKSKNIKLRTEPKTFVDIAESLEKLKRYENLDFLKSEQIRNKAIDDFVLALCGRTDCDKCVAEIMSVAEQMKRGEQHD